MIRSARATPRPMLALALILLAGCSTYDDQIATVERDVEQGVPDHAIDDLTAFCRAPEFGSGDNDYLILLHLAMLEFMVSKWGDCERDLRDADTQLEFIDYTSMPVSEVTRFLLSEDAGKYRGPPHEKLFVCLARLIAALALQDPELSAVAARRLVEQADYFIQNSEEATWNSPLWWYLAGVAFEEDGELDNARILYQRAYAAQQAPLFRDNYVRLAHRTGEEAQLEREGLHDLLYQADQGRQRLIVIVLNGRAPERVPVSVPIPIGVIESLGGKDKAMEAIGQIVKFGALKERASAFAECQVHLDRAGDVPVTRALDVEAQAMTWWKMQEPKVLTAAASRFVARLLAQKGVEKAAKDQGADDQWSSLWAGLTGLFLAAADNPDTRCWTLLPKEALVAECWLEPGEVSGTVTLRGRGEERRSFRVVLDPNKPAVVPIVIWK